jgi:hypothetical protein
MSRQGVGMATESFHTLVRAVIDASASKEWDSAVLEWDVTELEEDLTASGECVCGQTELVKLFTIRNKRNGAELYPIGSECVKKFGRSDLTRQTTLFSDLLKLRSAIQDGQPVRLDSEYFSRAILEYLDDKGAFTPDEWDSDGGYSFMLKMFNKRIQANITKAQRWKISAIMKQKIIPFVVADESLK